MTDNHTYNYLTWVFEAPPITWVGYETEVQTVPYEWPPDGRWSLLWAFSLLPGESTPVYATSVDVPLDVQFRVVCDRPYTARFYVADDDFTAIADAVELPGTADSHAATTETGIVYVVDPGAYDYIACVVTNNDGAQSAMTTITTRQEGEIQGEVQVEVVHTGPSAEPPWPGTYPDTLRLYGWHVAAGVLAAGWMTGALSDHWRTGALSDHWRTGALSDGGTP